MSDVQQAAQMGLRGGVEGRMPARVDLAHAAQMGGEMALLDERGEHCLDAGRHTLQERARYPLEHRHQRAWGDVEAEPQGREHRLGKRADIENALGSVGALQRRQRPPVVAELAVVVVLDDPGVLLIGGLKQFLAPPQAHFNAGRMLMGGRDEDQLEFAAQVARPASTDRPSIVDRDWRHARAAGDQDCCARR